MILHTVVRGEGEEKKLLGYMIQCPGCNGWHVIYTEQDDHVTVRWEFNGNLEKPTFSPSIKVQWREGPEQANKVCHFFVRDGMIQFCGDSTHTLAGQTVPLPDWE